MMLGAAGLFYHKWGRSWPSKVVCILQGFEDHTPLNAMQHTMLSEFGGAGHCPILGVAFLYTPTHWMMFIHTGQVCVALDGYYLQSAQLQPLAQVALEHFVEAGMPRKKIDYPQFWKQQDSISCGHHNLDFLKAVLFQGTLDDGIEGRSYHVPPNFLSLLKELERLSGWVLARHGQAPQASEPAAAAAPAPEPAAAAATDAGIPTSEEGGEEEELGEEEEQSQEDVEEEEDGEEESAPAAAAPEPAAAAATDAGIPTSIPKEATAAAPAEEEGGEEEENGEEEEQSQKDVEEEPESEHDNDSTGFSPDTAAELRRRIAALKAASMWRSMKCTHIPNFSL